MRLGTPPRQQSKQADRRSVGDREAGSLPRVGRFCVRRRGRLLDRRRRLGHFGRGCLSQVPQVVHSLKGLRRLLQRLSRVKMLKMRSINAACCTRFYSRCPNGGCPVRACEFSVLTESARFEPPTSCRAKNAEKTGPWSVLHQGPSLCPNSGGRIRTSDLRVMSVSQSQRST